MASDTGALELERVAAERRRLEAEAADAIRDTDIDHPAVVAQRIVDEVLRRRHLGVDVDEPMELDDPEDAGAIARRIVAEVLRDPEALARATAAAEAVTAAHVAAEAPTDRAASDGGGLPPFEARRTDRIYLVVPGDAAPLVLIPGDGVAPDTHPYVPELRDAEDPLDVRGTDGAALVDRALAPLSRHAPATAPTPDTTAEPFRRSGVSEHVAWIALAGLWLVAMAALVPLLAQGLERSIDATPPDFWEDSAVVEDGAPAGDDLDEELDPDAPEPEITP